MAQRMRVIDLESLPVHVPSKITIDGAYWFLRALDLGAEYTLDGMPLRNFGSQIDIVGLVAVQMDFPPIFDAEGRPVTWNQVLTIVPKSTAIKGTITIVYIDPSLEER